MKIHQMFLHIGFMLLANTILAQNISKGKARANNKSFSYHYMQPEREVQGILILLTGWGESTQGIFKKTELPRILSTRGFVTIVPELRHSLFADGYAIAQIDEVLRIQKERYNSEDLPFFIGGLSAGGAIALGYAEYVSATNKSVNLKGVFAIDPPLDLMRMFTSAENKIKYTCKSELIRKEGHFMKNYLLGSMGGSPKESPKQYMKYSVYSRTSADGGRAQYLKNIPLRLYSEPDLEFVQKTYCEDLKEEDINAFDLTHLHKFLIGIGNKKAEYITTKGKGFHSWNILDPDECARWMSDIILNK